MKHQPPYKDPSEAIQHIKDTYVRFDIHDTDSPGYSWREVAVVVSFYMDGETSKAVMWNVAHKKYKCPPDVAKALRKMDLLDDKRYGFFLRVTNKEEYDAFKKMLGDDTFAKWVWKHVGTKW